jgi:hypothetical protein
MKNKTKTPNPKYPPSKIKYLKNNPSVTFNLPVEALQKINDICRTESITKSQYLKRYFLNQVSIVNDLKLNHIAEIENIKKIAYENGYQNGKLDTEKMLTEQYNNNIETTINNRFASILESKMNESYDNGYNSGHKEGGWFKVKCSKCHKELNFDIHDQKDKLMILKFLNYQFHHEKCP